MEIDLQALNERVSVALQKGEILECDKLLQCLDNDFLKLRSITINDINIIRREAAKNYLKIKPVRVSSFLRTTTPLKWGKLSCGCIHLDNLLDGGIPRRGITELSGESGVGKTQLCLQMAVTVQLPEKFGGFNSGAVYICTEDKFPSTRLHQLFSTFPLSKTCTNYNQLGDNVFIEHIADVDGLKQCLLSQLPHLMKKKSIGLIVVDSITAVFRGEYDFHSMFQRAKDLRTIGLQLHKLAHQFNVAIVCINQVSSPIHVNKNNSAPIPSLGLAWANLVTTRLQMIRNEYQQRTLNVLFAPDLPKASLTYSVTANGIKGVTLND